MRQALPRDEDELRRIDFESWAPANSPVPRWDESRPFFGPPTGTQPDDVFVAENDGTVLGYVKLHATHADPSFVQINGFAVDQSARRSGVGLALLERAARAGRDRGFRRIELRVLGTNDVAIRLYQRAGFVETERREGEFTIADQTVDDLTLSLDLEL